MELKDAKMSFDMGSLKSSVISRNPMSAGYILIVKDKKNKDHIIAAQRSEKHEARIFKSIDAAVTCSLNIGFRDVLVSLK